MDTSYPYYGEDFCLVHGFDHMRSQIGNPIPFCQACEEDREQDERERSERERDRLKEPNQVGWMGDIGGNPFGPSDR